MKRIFLFLLTVLATLTAQAYDYPYLVFQTTDGTVTAVAVEALNITSSNGNLVVTNNDGTKTFPLSTLSKMYFSTDGTTDIDSAQTSDTTEVEVVAASGVSLGKFASFDEARKALEQGVYVVKSKGKTFKISVK